MDKSHKKLEKQWKADSITDNRAERKLQFTGWGRCQSELSGKPLKAMEVRPKDLGGSHADQIFVLRGSPECFAVRLSRELTLAPPPPRELQRTKRREEEI